MLSTSTFDKWEQSGLCRFLLCCILMAGALRIWNISSGRFNQSNLYSSLIQQPVGYFMSLKFLLSSYFGSTNLKQFQRFRGYQMLLINDEQEVPMLEENYWVEYRTP